MDPRVLHLLFSLAEVGALGGPGLRDAKPVLGSWLHHFEQPTHTLTVGSVPSE